MVPRSERAVATTRTLFLALLLVLAVEVGIGIATRPAGPWYEVLAVAGVTTYLFAAVFGLLLAGARWPALGDFGQAHAGIMVALVMGSAAAILGYLAFPDPAMLILGPFILAVFVFIGWAIERARQFLGC